MIKVGQIYSTGLLKWVVTHISDYPKYWATLIKNDGVVAGMYYEKDEDVEKQGKLIAEYMANITSHRERVRIII